MWIFFLILILSILRFINLGIVPVFGDEALYLNLADRILENPESFLDSIRFGVMPITIWFLFLIDYITPDFINPLILGRAVMVITDLISAFLVFLIGNLLLGKKVGALAPIIYLSIPLNFFHSRLVLLDSLTNALVLGAIYLALKTFYQKRLAEFGWFYIIIISLLLVFSFFTKPLAVVSFGAVFLIPLLAVFEKKINKKKLINLFLNFGLVLFLTVLALAIFYLPVSKEFTSRFVSESATLVQSFIRLKINLWKVFWWTRDYLTLPIIMGSLIGALFGVFKKSVKIIYLALWTGLVIILDSLFGSIFYPRHLYPIVAPVSILTGFLVVKFFSINKILGAVICLTILIPLWQKNFLLLTNPYPALSLEDKQQFYEDWTSGVGIYEIAQTLKDLSKNQKIKVFTEDDANQYWVLNNMYNIPDAQILVSQNLLKGKFIKDTDRLSKENTYIILNRNPKAPEEWPVKLIFSYPKGLNRTINLYQMLR